MRRFSNFRTNREVIKTVKKALEEYREGLNQRLDNDCIEEIVKTLERSGRAR